MMINQIYDIEYKKPVGELWEHSNRRVLCLAPANDNNLCIDLSEIDKEIQKSLVNELQGLYDYFKAERARILAEYQLHGKYRNFKEERIISCTSA